VTAKDEDDLDHDPLMSSMRSVFRDMRDTDEEPPSRGLDALMAAARTKAAEMQPAPEKESWWRRSFAMLLRPPMLAAATVVVLVGGAVVLNQRGTSVPTATTSSEREPHARAEGIAGKPEAAAKKGDVAIDPPTAAGAGSAAAAELAPRPPTMRRPARPVVRETIKPAPAETAAVRPERDEEPGTGEGNLEIAGGEADARPTGVKSTVRMPEPSTADSVTLSPPSGRPTVSTDQLVKQVEAAAARNDCAAVRVTAERVRKLDALAYKTRIATKPAIARCLK
jgi:hypothetical protein